MNGRMRIKLGMMAANMRVSSEYETGDRMVIRVAGEG
jgi:hypothetical protein